MPFLQDIARWTAETVGRDSAVIRNLRPHYESLLDRLSGGKGIPWEINGVTYRVDPHQRHRLSHEYDPAVAELLRRRIRRGAVCFDVGANVGIYVLQLAHWSGPDGQVVAFEPNPVAREVLLRHIAMNDLGHRVRVIPCAVGSAPGESVLYAAEANGMSRLGAPNREIADAVVPVRVEVVTLDAFCEANGIVPDVMLIDVEGFEIAALMGGARLIERLRETLLIVAEMHPAVWDSANTTRAQAEALLLSLRLRAFPLTGQRDPLGEYGQVRLYPGGNDKGE